MDNEEMRKESLIIKDYIYVNGRCVKRGETKEPELGTWCFYPFFQDKRDPVASFRWGLGEDHGLCNSFAHGLFESGLVYLKQEHALERAIAMLKFEEV